jgi:hypothetical protein
MQPYYTNVLRATERRWGMRSGSVSSRDIKDAQVIKEERDISVGAYKDLHESSFAAAKGYQGRDKRWHAWIEGRMDALEKFGVYLRNNALQHATQVRIAGVPKTQTRGSDLPPL